MSGKYRARDNVGIGVLTVHIHDTDARLIAFFDKMPTDHLGVDAELAIDVQRVPGDPVQQRPANKGDLAACSDGMFLFLERVKLVFENRSKYPVGTNVEPVQPHGEFSVLAGSIIAGFEYF